MGTSTRKTTLTCATIAEIAELVRHVEELHIKGENMTHDPSKPHTAEEAVKIARARVGRGVYTLGTGNWDTKPDDPSDCAGFAINACYGLRRHRPGFNEGSWATVTGDLNCNSAIEDAHHKQELFEAITRPEVGCLLTYPTFTIKGMRVDDAPHTFIGHVGIVVGVPAEWDKEISGYGALTVVQCCGPNGHKPGIIMTNGSHWDKHDATWPRPEHRTVMLRVKQPTENVTNDRAANKFRQTADEVK